MTELRKELPPLPDRLKALPIARGYPVPWFVAWVNGEPDFRVVDAKKLFVAIDQSRCWLCGEHRGRFGTFVVGPLGAINNISSEPPSHLECARFGAMACPFLVRPHAVRREAGLPEGSQEPAGTMIRRNPGVSLLLTSRDFHVISDGGRPLWQMGAPTRMEWLAEGRAATHEEVMHSIETGRPALDKAGMPPEYFDDAMSGLRPWLPAAPLAEGLFP
jgi:hypothetical protein